MGSETIWRTTHETGRRLERKKRNMPWSAESGILDEESQPKRKLKE